MHRRALGILRDVGFGSFFKRPRFATAQQFSACRSVLKHVWRPCCDMLSAIGIASQKKKKKNIKTRRLKPVHRTPRYKMWHRENAIIGWRKKRAPYTYLWGYYHFVSASFFFFFFTYSRVKFPFHDSFFNERPRFPLSFDQSKVTIPGGIELRIIFQIVENC